MLGKTAGGLYWMYRYMERAENMSRLIETGQRIALTRSHGADDEWGSILKAASTDRGYGAKNGGDVRRETVVDWMLRDRDNPGSILSIMDMARNNARLVRTALTPEVWEAVNAAWMTLRQKLSRKVTERELPELLGTIRQRTALVRGATHGTMMRNDIYDFARLGTFIERGDYTGRLLDVKYYVLLPTAHAVGSSLDNVQWETILRSVSARGGFRMAYGHEARPRDIAQFLILDPRMPRSLNFCVSKLRDNLGYLASDYGVKHPSLSQAEELKRRFMSHDIDAIFDYGLHEYIQGVLAALGGLSQQIEIDYRFNQ